MGGMKESKVFKIILIILAVILVVFGGWRLFNPLSFYTFSALVLPNEAGLLSEVRGAGGIIMVSGLVVASGVFRHEWSRTSILLAAVVYLPLGLGRVIGFALDGSPGSGVIPGMAIELACGALALFAYFKYRETDVA
jgi:hypothetical protein